MPYSPSERFAVTKFILGKLKPVKDIPETVEFFIKSKNKPEKIVIRKAKPSDLKAISELDLEFAKSQYKNYDKTLNLNWTYSRSGQKYLKKRMSRNDSFLKIASNEQGKIIAYISGGLIKPHPLSVKARYAELESIFIKDEYRGSGLGKKLTEDFINWCRKIKVDYINLAVANENEKTINLYKKLGFRESYSIMEIDLKSEREKKS